MSANSKASPRLRQIAYISSSTVPSRAANTVHVLNMAAGFAGLGLDVTLFARGEAGDMRAVLRDFGIDTPFDIDLTPWRRPGLIDRIGFIRHLRRRAAPFDFAYGRSCYPLLWGVPRGVPIAYDLHSFSTHPVQRRLEGLLFRRPNFLFATAINSALAEAYASAYPHLAGRLVVAPCAAAFPKAPARPARRKPGPLRVTYVGHLYEGRGIDLILALAALRPEFEFHIVGGEDADIARWRAQAPTNMIFHGYVRPAALAAYYASADVCISPHQRKVSGSGGGNIAAWTSPMKLFEYMSFGKPIVASDLPAIREILRDGENAMLCPPDDLSAWSAMLNRLEADEALRDRLGTAAAAEFREHYTWDARARLIIDTAVGLIGRRSGE